MGPAVFVPLAPPACCRQLDFLVGLLSNPAARPSLRAGCLHDWLHRLPGCEWGCFCCFSPEVVHCCRQTEFLSNSLPVVPRTRPQKGCHWTEQLVQQTWVLLLSVLAFPDQRAAYPCPLLLWQVVRRFKKANNVDGAKLNAFWYDLFSWAVVVTHVFPETFRSGVHQAAGIRLVDKTAGVPAERE